MLTPGHFIDAQLHEAVEAVRVEVTVDNAFADPSDGVPVDAQEPGDRGLVGLGGKESCHLFEVGAEPGPVAGERDSLDQDPMVGAVDPAQIRADDCHRSTEVEMPPGRRRGSGVVAGPGGERQNGQANFFAFSRTSTRSRPGCNTIA